MMKNPNVRISVIIDGDFERYIVERRVFGFFWIQEYKTEVHRGVGTDNSYDVKIYHKTYGEARKAAVQMKVDLDEQAEKKKARKRKEVVYYINEWDV